MTQPLIRVFDCETSALDDDARMCEIGWTDVRHDGDAWLVDKPRSELVNPGCFIKPEASAVHHITDAIVKDCRPADEALRALALSDVDLWAAHFAKFDRRFFNPDGSTWICTYKLAVRAWPDAPNHKNQTLRYYLGLPIDTVAPGLPHRAKLDSFVTGSVLCFALNRGWTVDQCVQISSVPALLPRVNFGKHVGKAWSAVPTDYLEWYLRQPDQDEDIQFTCRHWLAKAVDAREDRAPPPIRAGDYLKAPESPEPPPWEPDR